MHIIYEIIFYLSIFLILYVYFGYPIIIYNLGRFKKYSVQKGFYEPNITILISAYNEELFIKKTIMNKLSLDYPPDKLEIIIISDCSDDKTDDIVKNFKDKRVKLVRLNKRQGKTSALNCGYKHASGDILVFSDANSQYSGNSLRNLMENFNDPNVGYVTGKMIYQQKDDVIVGNGCSTYMKYENFLRVYETMVGSIVGVDGGIDAVRKELYEPMAPEQLPDFVLPLKIIELGYRVVFEPNALLYEYSLEEPAEEYYMRVRVSLRTFWALFDMRKLMSIKNFSFYSFQIISHKVLRYLCFIYLIMVYFTNLIILNNSLLYKLTFSIQNCFYLLALYAYIAEKFGKYIGFSFYFYYFVLINLASMHALIKFILGHKTVIWTPRKG